MTDFEHDYAPADPTQEDARRKAALLGSDAQARANTFVDFLSGGNARAEFEATSAHLTRSKQGVLGAMTGQQAAQNVAERQATVGSAFGQERPLERLGGTVDWSAFSDSPAPARRDLRFVNQVAPPAADAMSPTLRWSRGER
jgi:hypothetical protein